jgi:hypothetical protein
MRLVLEKVGDDGYAKLLRKFRNCFVQIAVYVVPAWLSRSLVILDEPLLPIFATLLGSDSVEGEVCRYSVQPCAKIRAGFSPGSGERLKAFLSDIFGFRGASEDASARRIDHR